MTAIRSLSRLTVFAALLAVAGVKAQTAPSTTDVGPPPAEDRASTGAVVLEKSPVPALRDKLLSDTAKAGAAPSTATETVVKSRTRTRAQTRAAQARARSAEAAELRRSGAGSLTGR